MEPQEPLLIRIDERLLAWATRFAHWFQRLTGRTSFFLAKCCLLSWACAQFVDIFNYFSPLPGFKEPDAAMLFMSCIILCGIILRAVSLDYADKQQREGRTAIPAVVLELRKVSFRWLRMLFLGMCVLDLWLIPLQLAKPFWVFYILDMNSTPSLLCHEYFILVNPLPPGVSRVRHWVSRFAVSLRPARAEA